MLQADRSNSEKEINSSHMAGKVVDLELALSDAKEARRFIQEFDWAPLEPPKFVVFGIDEKIYLSNMSDKDAVTAAKIILHDVYVPTAMREKKLAFWEH